MNNIPKKHVIILFAVAVFAVILVLFLPSLSRDTSIHTSTSIDQEISESDVIITEIDFGDTEPVQITLEEAEHTAFSALQKATESADYDLKTEQYDFGVFVKSINGYESTAERSWIYFVNGVSGDIAADQKVLQPGEVVSWRYVEPTAE